MSVWLDNACANGSAESSVTEAICARCAMTSQHKGQAAGRIELTIS